jgi:cell division protein FtsQ
MKRFIQIAFFILSVTLVTGLMAYVYVEHQKKPLQQVEIHVARSSEKGFLDKEEIYKCIEKHLSDTTRLKDLDLSFIEDSLTQTPWVDEIDAFIDIEGNLIINIKESEPVLRIFSQSGSTFFLDKNGKILPVSRKYTPRLLVANGYIKASPIKGFRNINDTIYKNSNLKALLAVSKTIENYPFLKSLISEIYVNSNNEIDLTPMVGNQLIHLGDTTNLNHKLENLIFFYKKSLVYEGWDKYTTLDLKYRNQIVCTKK